MTETLDLDDIQGNIVRAYGRYNYPVARYFFLQFTDLSKARPFVGAVRRKVTTAARWTAERPETTLNIGFTFFGLWALGLPTRLLQELPDAFFAGIRARAYALGDRDPAAVAVGQEGWDKHWDTLWQENRVDDSKTAGNVHVWISINAQVEPGTDTPVEKIEEETEWLIDLCERELEGGVRIMTGHGSHADIPFQAATALFETLPDGTRRATPKEHFGYTDGISDPVFAGQYPPEIERERVIGRGKWMDPETGWQPLATGEFLLGHVDESQALPPTAPPPEFMRNGSFMVYRKLHQNVDAFRNAMDVEAERYAAATGVDAEAARATVAAKVVGRWKDGVPLAKAPDYAAWRALAAEKGFDDPETAREAYQRYFRTAEASDFRYGDDMDGARCPLGAHLRRANTRDQLDPDNQPGAKNPEATSRLNKRRRILRRGLPYGPSDPDAGSDDGEQGIIFMAICADIFRQFEFIQQQWMEYGLDFHTGNTPCPLIGRGAEGKIHVIQADPEGAAPPFIMREMKTFVETRGGDYFFLPSMTALRLIEMGVVDPT